MSFKKSEEKKEFNIVKGWSLWCYDIVDIKKGAILKCCMSSKKDEKNYSAPLYLDVVALEKQCDIMDKSLEDLKKSKIEVDGFIKIGDFTPKGSDKAIVTVNLFANEIR